MNYFYVQTLVSGTWGDLTDPRYPIRGRAEAEQAENKVKQFITSRGRSTADVRLRELVMQDVIKLLTEEQKEAIVLAHLTSAPDSYAESLIDGALDLDPSQKDL